MICSSKPKFGGIFFLLWPFSVSCYLSLGFNSKVNSVPVHSLGNSKAAAHVACRPKVLVHCKACKERTKNAQALTFCTEIG